MLMSAIIGHRGARGLAPENTLKSIELAAELGVRWVELDVMLTRDQVPILFHDAWLNKLSNGRGQVEKFDFSALEHLRVLAPRGAKDRSSQPLATLASGLRLIQELGLGLNLEIKPTCAEKDLITLQLAVQELRAFPGLPLVISSFSDQVLAEAQRLLPDVPRACLWEELPDNWHLQARALGARSIHLSSLYLKHREVAEIKGLGRELYVYTVNTKKQAEKFFSWGVTGIFTDYPQRFQALSATTQYHTPFGEPV
ncbi:glycerophosphodiester phosphodiesterase family protein [Marinospirillum sp.]|uniref:glycerophosphodiester phosphodiesterase family protein n=1 Tax=Marinospirillum sp. TaxID=2183934 RepID=UPI00384B3513